MRGYPTFATPAARASYLVERHRLHELPFEELNPSELQALAAELHAELRRVRRRAIRAHTAGIVLTAIFVLLGALVLGLGPAMHITMFSAATVGSLEAEGTLWVVLLALAAAGAASADYVLRRRLRIARMFEHEAQTIRHAIARAEHP